MRKIMKNCAGLAGVGAFIALSSFAIRAQDGSAPRMDAGAKTMLKSADMNFAVKAAQGGLAEVQMGQLAASKASNPDVKAFGQKMVDDHTKANDQLKSIAEKQNVTLPATMAAKEQSEYNRLRSLSGADFDKAYVKGMVKDHEEDVKEFQKEASSGKDPQIKAFAAETLPTLQGHLDMIKSIQSKMASGAPM